MIEFERIQLQIIYKGVFMLNNSTQDFLKLFKGLLKVMLKFEAYK